MGTGSRIGYKTTSGKVYTIYCKCDSQLEHTGKTLFYSYNTIERVKFLINTIGPISSLGACIHAEEANRRKQEAERLLREKKINLAGAKVSYSIIGRQLTNFQREDWESLKEYYEHPCWHGGYTFFLYLWQKGAWYVRKQVFTNTPEEKLEDWEKDLVLLETVLKAKNII